MKRGHRTSDRSSTRDLERSSSARADHARSESKAIDSGAQFIAESFLFAVGAALILGESWRSRAKEEKRRDFVAESIEALQAEVREIREDMQTERLERAQVAEKESHLQGIMEQVRLQSTGGLVREDVCSHGSRRLSRLAWKGAGSRKAKGMSTSQLFRRRRSKEKRVRRRTRAHPDATAARKDDTFAALVSIPAVDRRDSHPYDDEWHIESDDRRREESGAHEDDAADEDLIDVEGSRLHLPFQCVVLLAAEEIEQSAQKPEVRLESEAEHLLEQERWREREHCHPLRERERKSRV